MEKQLIEDLGGPTSLAKALGIKPNVVANWQHPDRGIPWKHRQGVAGIANRLGVHLPEGFWTEDRL